MKNFIIAGIILVIFPSVAIAKTMYVSDVVEITLRREAGVGQKIIQMIKSGQNVEMIESGEEWSKVRLPNGKEGWALTRFLTSDRPSKAVLTILRKQYKELKSQSAVLLEENKKYKDENDDLKSQITKKNETLDNVTNSYNSLKSESAEFLELKENYKKASYELKEISEKAELMENELNKLRSSNIIWLLVTGAGILFFGIMLGMSTKSQRKRYH